jgi:hypothetical protein
LSGEQVETRNCGPVTFDFGCFSVVSAPKVLDINSFLPDGLPKLAGVFSLQTFQNHPITIDYSRGLVTIENPESFNARTRDMTEIPLAVTREKDGEAVTMFVQVQETPEPLWFYMDSGNLRGVLLSDHAAELLGVEDSGPLTLRIAGLTYDSTGEVMDMIYDGVVDVEFFKAYEISIDLENSRAWMRPGSADD